MRACAAVASADRQTANLHILSADSTRRAKRPAPQALICPPCPAPSEKIFCFSEVQITAIFAAVPSHRGASRDRHGRGAGCGGRGCADNERRFSADVQSRVVLTPRRWCQVCEKERRRRWPTSPEHRGDHGVAVKTIAWGMPGDSGVTCMLVCALPLPLHTRPWDASGARHSLRPQFGEGGNK